jgi:5-methylcytosine-specific restriction endonuclease McrA
VPGPPKAPPGVTRNEVSRLLDAGWAEVEIARKLGVSKSAVCYHARNLSRPLDERFARRYDWSEIQRYYDQGHDLAECVARFGFSKASWSQAVKRGDIRPRPRAASIERYLVVGRRTSRTHLKGRLLAAGLKSPRCEECNIEDWQGRPLSHELHHRNGRKDDNRLGNLVILCPNCHSQTHTWGGRNKRALNIAATVQRDDSDVAGKRYLPSSS